MEKVYMTLDGGTEEYWQLNPSYPKFTYGYLDRNILCRLHPNSCITSMYGVQPSDFYQIIFHILRNKFHADPEVKHYKHHRNHLRKHNCFRYCKTEEVDQIGHKILRIQGFHEPEKFSICRVDGRIISFNYAAAMKAEGKEYPSLEDILDKWDKEDKAIENDAELLNNLEDEELGFGFEDDEFDFDDDFDLGDEDEWK